MLTNFNYIWIYLGRDGIQPLIAQVTFPGGTHVIKMWAPKWGLSGRAIWEPGWECNGDLGGAVKGSPDRPILGINGSHMGPIWAAHFCLQ